MMICIVIALHFSIEEQDFWIDAIVGRQNARRANLHPSLLSTLKLSLVVHGVLRLLVLNLLVVLNCCR